MIGSWFDTLDPNRRTLTVALVLVCLATLPLYGLGVWRLKTLDQVAQTPGLVDDTSQTTDVPQAGGSVEPSGNEPAPIQQAAAPPGAVVAAPTSQAAKPAAAVPPQPVRRSGGSPPGHEKKKEH